MFRLASILYSLIGTSLAGTLVVVALVMGHDTASAIIIAAAVGAVLALPASYAIARMIVNQD